MEIDGKVWGTKQLGIMTERDGVMFSTRLLALVDGLEEKVFDKEGR